MLTVIIKQISNLGQNNLIDFAYSELWRKFKLDKADMNHLVFYDIIVWLVCSKIVYQKDKNKNTPNLGE